MPTNPMKLVADLEPGERSFTVTMFGYLFLVTATFWILKPLKKALFIQYYDANGVTLAGWHLEAAEAELIAKLLNMLVAIVAVAVFTWVATRLRRQVLSRAFAGAFVLAFALYTIVLARPGDTAVWSFYLFGDLFSTIMVAAFFAFLNDSVSPEAAKRLYGPIVAGGVGGGVFGALVLSTWIERLTPPQWLGVCCAMGAAIAGMAWLAGRAHRALPAESRSPEHPAAVAPARNPAIAGAALVFRSRYLLAVVAIVTLYEIVSTVMDFQFTSTVAHYFEGPAIGKHLSRVFAFTNVVSLLVQVFVTSAVMSRFGVGTALLVLPAAAFGASAAFLAAPTLWLGSLLNTADNALNYSINQSAKEALYTPTTPDEKYAAKAFIDMFGQRFAKTIGVGASLAMSQWFHDFASVRWLSLVSIAVIGLWAAAARYAGRTFRERASEPDEHARPLVPGRDREAHALRGR
jgi:AAA family ATP:ADP antiporter